MSSRRPVASSPPSAGARGLRDVLGLATSAPDPQTHGSQYPPPALPESKYPCVEHVDLSTSETTISEWAFSECRSLVTVTLPPNLATIENGAFYNCANLKATEHGYKKRALGTEGQPLCLRMPGSLTTVGEAVFSGCRSLERVDLSACTGLTTIPKLAFQRCSSLVSVGLPPSLETIGELAFWDCINLKTSLPEAPGTEGQPPSLRMPESLTTIGNGAFTLCRELRKVDFSACRKVNIQRNAFSGCVYLEEVDLSTIEELKVDYPVFKDSVFLELTVRESQRDAYLATKLVLSDDDLDSVYSRETGMSPTATLVVVSEGTTDVTMEDP